MQSCRTDALVYNLVLALPADEIQAGNEAHDLFERYSGQISAVKKIAEQQKEADFVVAEAERKKAKGKQKAGNLTDDPMESERDTAETDAEGEEEEDPPAEAQAPKKPKRLRRDKKSAPYVLVGGEAAPAKVSFSLLYGLSFLADASYRLKLVA